MGFRKGGYQLEVVEVAQEEVTYATDCITIILECESHYAMFLDIPVITTRYQYPDRFLKIAATYEIKAEYLYGHISYKHFII